MPSRSIVRPSVGLLHFDSHFVCTRAIIGPDLVCRFVTLVRLAGTGPKESPLLCTAVRNAPDTTLSVLSARRAPGGSVKTRPPEI